MGERGVSVVDIEKDQERFSPVDMRGNSRYRNLHLDLNLDVTMDSTDAFFLPSRPEGSDSPSNFVFTRSRRRVAQDNEKPAPLEGDVLDLAPTDGAVSRRRRVPN